MAAIATPTRTSATSAQVDAFRRQSREKRRRDMTPTARMVGAILDGVASTAANVYIDARRLALSVAEAFIDIATQAHQAAELAAQIGGATW